MTFCSLKLKESMIPPKLGEIILCTWCTTPPPPLTKRRPLCTGIIGRMHIRKWNEIYYVAAFKRISKKRHIIHLNEKNP